MRMALGVYVLGAIDPAERSRLEAHLLTCPACRDELAGMAGLPALLSRVSEPQIELEDGELLESLLARAASEGRPVPFRPSRRILLGLSVAAALLIGILLGGVFTGGDTPPPREQVAAAEEISAINPVTHVGATVYLTKKGWGTALEVEVNGAPVKTSCKMIAIGTDGRQDPAGSWTVLSTQSYGGYQGSTMIGRAELREIRIVTTEGKDLVTVPVT